MLRGAASRERRATAGLLQTIIVQIFARLTAANDYTAVLTDKNALAVNFSINAGNSYFAAPDPNNPSTPSPSVTWR